MRRTRSTLLALACGVLVAACSGVTTVADTTTGPTSEPAAAPSTEPAPVGSPSIDDAVSLLSDPFDDDRNGWGGQHQTFVDGAYVWELPHGGSDQRASDVLIAIEDQLAHTRTSTTFTAQGARAVGITCGFEEVDGSSRWYSLELGVDGAVIRKRPLGTGPVETLARSDDVVLSDSETTIEATCLLDDGAYRLGFAVDGEGVLAVEDDEPFGPGAPDLLVRAATQDEHTGQPTVRFDRFEVLVPDGGPRLDAG